MAPRKTGCIAKFTQSICYGSVNWYGLLDVVVGDMHMMKVGLAATGVDSYWTLRGGYLLHLEQSSIHRRPAEDETGSVPMDNQRPPEERTRVTDSNAQILSATG